MSNIIVKGMPQPNSFGTWWTMVFEHLSICISGNIFKREVMLNAK